MIAGRPQKRPVGEGCYDMHNYIADHGQAEGIVRIHAACEPPCRRKRAALVFLQNARSLDTGGTDHEADL